MRRSDPVLEWMSALGITLLAGVLRFWSLGRPHSFEFDETYYAKDAWSLLHFGYAHNYVDNANAGILAGHTTNQWASGPEMIVHPEVGKWLIAIPEQLFGMNPFAWRVAPAIVGTLMVLLMIRFTRRITGSNLLGLTAGVLMCCDGLQLVLSRLALLDIFAAFFILLAIHCMVLDRDWGRRRLAQCDIGDTWGPRLWWRPWRLVAGVVWGLAIGTKWDALFFLGATCLLMWAWDAGARRRLGVRWSVVKAAIVDELPALGYLILIPFIVYVFTWTGWLIHHQVYEASLSNTQYGPFWGNYIHEHPSSFLGQTWQALRSLAHYHYDVYNFHVNFLNASHHVYQSNPDGWLLLNRPVGVDAQLDIKPGAQGCTAAAGSTCLRQVLLLGTPILWWLAAAALLVCAVLWVARKDWRYGLVVLPVLAGWLPWFRYDDRPIFSYYTITFEPYLILGLVMVLGLILGSREASTRRRRTGAIIAGTMVVAVAANFAFFWPIYTDGLLTNAQWLQRIWFKRWI